MPIDELLNDAFDRIAGVVAGVLDDVPDAVLTWRADAEANTVAWLVWHLSRVQDDHVCGAFGVEQVWTSDGWADRLDLPFGEEIGYGQDPAEVARVVVPAELLRGYHRAVHRRCGELLAGVTAEDLDRVVDEDWDPPVTLGARLVSVLSDTLQHAGQAAFVRGLASRTG